ncbi:MAG: hypothetical protein ABIR60_05180, partial [Allosphingosinicella sp.]
VAYVPRHDPAVDLYAEGAEAATPQPAQLVVETPAPNPARDRIQAYSSYPVSSNEKPAEVTQTAAESPAEAPAEPTGL